MSAEKMNRITGDGRIRVGEICGHDIGEIAGLEGNIFPDAWSRQALSETFARPYAVILGAWLKDRLAGYLILYYVADEGEIVRVGVAEHNRRQGIGRALLNCAEELLKLKGGERLLLDVRESNAAAIALYKKQGFSEDGIRKKFYTDPVEDAILMSHKIEKIHL